MATKHAPNRFLRPPSWLGLAVVGWLAACAGKTPDTVTPAPVAPPTQAPATDDDLAQRLALLSERLEAARVENHIPGMAVAVVKGDEIIFAEGFGHADLEAKREATPETVFAVGSTTKAFTSALVAMQVDAGKMDWDDPITTHVPEFQLKPTPHGEEKKAPALTVRDMLSHRSGFTRMGMLWIAGNLTPAEMFAKASGAEPVAGYDDKFLYNNVTYASAGEAAARTADTTWAQMLQTRILEPLGMGHTTVTVAGAKADPNLAQGYRWREVIETHEALPMRNLDTIAPAGAINSNVLDMAQWLRLQLGHGTYEGTELVSAKSLDTTWKSQIKVGGGIEYGLGWMLGDWQGHRVVEHGGNIDGYAAEVGMLPDDDIGFVLLTNISATPLQRGSLGIVFESLLGDLPSDEADAPAEQLDLAPYLGKFVADFGPFDDARFTVSAENGRLYVDVPGQTKYELKAPNEEGHWVFALTDAIKVSFDLDQASGKAQVLHMYQGGLEFELPLEGYTFPAEFERSEVAELLGRYKNDKLPLDTTVKLVQGRMVSDVKGQMPFVMKKPGENGRWGVRATDTIELSFRRDKANEVDALILHQGGKDIELLRVEGKEAPLPTVAQLLERSKADAFTKRLRKKGPLEVSGTVKMPSSAMVGRFRLVFDADRRIAVDMDFGEHGRMREVYDGTEAWSLGTMSPPTQAHGKYLEQAKLSMPLLAGNWTQGYESAEVEGRTTHDGKEVIEVILRAKDLPPMKVYVDEKSGEPQATEQQQLAEGVGTIGMKGTLSDYKKSMGFRIPHRVRTYNVHSGATTFEVESVKTAEGDPAELFNHRDIRSTKP